jgi:hypothetical protein
MNGRPRGNPLVPTDDVDARVGRGVLRAPDGGQQLNVGPMRPQLITDDRCARLVFIARRIDGRNADQPRRKIDDLVPRLIDLLEEPLGRRIHR